MLFTQRGNSYRLFLHYVKIAGLSAILISNTVYYLHLSMVVHYKKLCNNKLLRVLLILIQIIKLMPPYWDKAPARPTLILPDPLFSTF